MRLTALSLAIWLAALANPAPAQGPEVQEFNYYNTDIHLVLKALSEMTGVTFVEDVPVQGKVTIHIGGRAPLDEVLETVLKPLGLTWRTVDKVYHIGLKGGERAAPSRPGYIQKTFMLKTVAAGEAARRLRKFLRARGIVSVNLPMNEVTVMVPPALLPDVENLVKSTDVEVTRKLIAIRVKVLEITRDLDKDDRVSLSYSDYPSGLGLGSYHVPTPNQRRNWGVGSNADWDSDSGRQDEGRSLYRHAVTFTVGAWGIDQTVARIMIQEEIESTKVLSEPDLVLVEGKKATLNIGQLMPKPSGTGGYVYFQDYESVGVELMVDKLSVSKEGVVQMYVKSILTQRVGEHLNTKVDMLDRREVDTTMSAVNGDTVRLGGLFRREELARTIKVPILGDLPLLGFLFRSHATSSVRKEVVILISPSIIEDVPPHGRRTPGISALVAWLIPGTTNVMLDWSDDVPVDNVGVFQYKIYRDVNPITNTMGIAPIAPAVSRAASAWVDETPKRRGATYYYAVIAVDGAGNRQAVSNSPGLTIPKR